MTRLSAFFSWILDACLYLAIALIPLWYSTRLTEPFEIPKQTLLVSIALVALVAWLGKGLAEKRFFLFRSWTLFVVCGLTVGFFLFSLFSIDRYTSFVGGPGNTAWAFVTIASCFLLYAVAMHRIRSSTDVYHLVFAFFASSLVAALIGIFQMAKIYLLPGALSYVQTFSTVGSSYGLAIFLTVPLVMAVAMALHGCRDDACLINRDDFLGIAARAIVWLSIVASFAVLLLTDLRAAWILLFLGLFGLLAISYALNRRFGKWQDIWLPVLLMACALIFFLIKVPYKPALPGEITPSFAASWSIAQKTLIAHPLVGTGPGTWGYDYAMYRAPQVNDSVFWATRFDHAYSSFLAQFATIGLIGISLWLFFVGFIIVQSGLYLKREKDQDRRSLFVMVFCGWVLVTGSQFFYSITVAHQVVAWILLACLAGLLAHRAWEWDLRHKENALALFFALFLSVGMMSVLGWYAIGSRWIAEKTYARAIGQYAQNPQAGLEKFMQARIRNPFVDVYARALSQAYVKEALQRTTAKNRLDEIPGLVAKAVDEARRATDLVPAHADNWANLAATYQAVMGMTDRADEFAIKNYLQAHAREPQNPIFVVEIGRIFFARAEKARASESRESMVKDLDMAGRWFGAAIGLKSDYDLARYYLGVVYERQGRIEHAIRELEALVQQDRRDLGIAFELALLYHRNGQKERSVRLLEQIVTLEENHSNAQWYLASFYAEAKRWTEALRQLEILAKKYPKDTMILQALEATQKFAENRSAKPFVYPEPLRINGTGSE